MVEVKFCGLTRAEDAAIAASLDATYGGVIFAGGPRERTPEVARGVLDGAAGALTRVGVFGSDFRERLGDVANRAILDTAQLHADPGVVDVQDARRIFGGAIWAAVRLAGDTIPRGMDALFAEADAVLLDARIEGKLGGAGVALAWERIAGAVAAVRGAGRLVLAGGLTPENVGFALAALEPDVVDVSSGVESAPGIKDHLRMEAFVRAVREDGQ